MQFTILLMTKSGKIHRAPKIQESRELIHSQVIFKFSEPAKINVNRMLKTCLQFLFNLKSIPFWNLRKAVHQILKITKTNKKSYQKLTRWTITSMGARPNEITQCLSENENSHFIDITKSKRYLHDLRISCIFMVFTCADTIYTPVYILYLHHTVGVFT